MQWQTMLLVEIMILLVIFPVATVFLIGLSYGFGTIEQTLSVTWLIGAILILTIPSEKAHASEPLTFDIRGAVKRPA